MNLERRSLILVVSALAIYKAAAAQADYPNRTIKLIVPYGAGGSTDTLARIIARELADRLGQSVIVENRSGANGIIGADVAAKAAPDGYTFLMASNGQAVNVSLYKSLPYDQTRDFVPVVNVASMPNVIAVHPSQPMQTMKDLIAFAKANPGSVAFAHAGVGSSQHLSGELLKLLAGIDIRQIPYKGGGPAIADALAGHVQMVIAGIPAIAQYAKDGQLRPLAVTGSKRLPQLPNVPTMMEAGFPTYDEVFWVGIMAPHNVPGEIISRINSAVNEILATPAVAQTFARQGAEPVGGTPQQFGTFVQREIEEAAKIIKSARIEP